MRDRRESSTRDPSGDAPDYRNTLANERTFLAWMRTALGILAGAVAIAQFARAIPDGLRLFAGLALVAVATGASLVGYRSWRLREQRMHSGLPIAHHGSLLAMAGAVWILALLVAVIVLVSSD